MKSWFSVPDITAEIISWSAAEINTYAIIFKSWLYKESCGRSQYTVI
jgi:hypothetical protein